MQKLKIWFTSIFAPFWLLKQNFGSLIRFELLYRALALLVFFPVLTWMQRLLLLVNGTSNVTADNAKTFLCNPLTWVVLFFMCVAMTVCAMFERFAITDALHASRCGLHQTARQMFSTGFDLCVERFRPSNWGLIFYALIILHFGSILDISSITTFIHVPGYILEDFELHPYKKVIYYVLIVLAVCYFVRWLFTIPIMMEEDNMKFSAAAKKSARMTHGRYFFHLALLVLFWTVLSSLLFVAFSAMIVLIWYLGSLWLQPGQTQAFSEFFTGRYQPVTILFFIIFQWLTAPLMLASFQAAYYRRKEELKEKIQPYTEEPHYLKNNRPLFIVVVSFVIISVFFAGPKRFSQIKWMLNTNYGVPLIMAHRGYSAAAPENTVPAFQKSIDEGFTAAELDVQMTKDGEIIVLHDSSLKRTTGLNKRVWEVTYDEIKDLDNGSFFSKEYAGTTIPTLDEVLKLCKDKLYLNIEIKRTGHDDGITQKVVDIIADNDFFDECDITSQNYHTLEEVREINPDVLTAYTSIIGIGDIQNLEAADIISIQETFATYENINNLHTAGKRVFVWTVNESSTMQKLISLNVDAILTNNPGLCKSVIDKYSSNVLNIAYRVQQAFAFL